MPNFDEILSQWDMVSVAVVFFGGMMTAWLILATMSIRELRRQFDDESRARFMPLLRLVPGVVGSDETEDSIDLTVKNHGASPATDMQLEARWGNRVWALPQAVMLGPGALEKLRLPRIDGKHGPGRGFLQVTARFATLNGLTCEKTIQYAAGPGGEWFVYASEETVSKTRRRRLQRGTDALPTGTGGSSADA